MKAPAWLSAYPETSEVSTTSEVFRAPGAVLGQALGLLICSLLLAGCKPSGPETYPVSGKVTFQGEPVPKGYIILAPPDGSVAPDAGPITDGTYQFRARPGKKRVEIHADRESGPVDPVMGTPPRKPYIPAKYNAQTTLTAEVKPDGDNKFNFDLTADEKPAATARPR